MSDDAHEPKTCTTCGRPESTEDYPCQCDCDHSDMEEGFCLICDKDRTEELCGLAYDIWKDSKKYE